VKRSESDGSRVGFLKHIHGRTFGRVNHAIGSSWRDQESDPSRGIRRTDGTTALFLLISAQIVGIRPFRILQKVAYFTVLENLRLLGIKFAIPTKIRRKIRRIAARPMGAAFSNGELARRTGLLLCDGCFGIIMLAQN
jgi:hypothetical protein